ncbi:conjugal transfer protein TrbJ [Cupriavidus sp. UME77]|uniref:conjugal transfer protein TrbJ n=1 Tax=Cupriavidus sp. UME77 TaxID=1862321 RepID=UPI001602C26B|nr:conjugal transfer protein TrbJ [Cupriavidus sp. UME77]MBB1631146.1 conjugal transfer protein TrbJ [Cupriavidus sp. UME77]
MIKRMTAAGILALAMGSASMPAFASGWPVFDAANFLKNTLTAAQALKTEVYENTNIAYQYKMMLNQLLQATGLDPAALTAQANAIKDDITKHEQYGQALQSLYGGVSENADFLARVQSLVVQSGKTPEQWFQDQRTLIGNGDKAAKQLFSIASKIAGNNQSLAKRRAKIQEDMTLSPTAQATAEATNHMLDVLASQNSDVLQLMSAKAQTDATKDQRALAADTEATNVTQQIQRDQEAQLNKLRQTVFKN